MSSLTTLLRQVFVQDNFSLTWLAVRSSPLKLYFLGSSFPHTRGTSRHFRCCIRRINGKSTSALLFAQLVARSIGTRRSVRLQTMGLIASASNGEESAFEVSVPGPKHRVNAIAQANRFQRCL